MFDNPFTKDIPIFPPNWGRLRAIHQRARKSLRFALHKLLFDLISSQIQIEIGGDFVKEFLFILIFLADILKKVDKAFQSEVLM
jgi:hypothetical protein